jgi:ABC-type Fe3+-hydroxamate transport system substrate-binding protein
LYQNKNGTASIQLSPEQVIKDEKSCVIWINAEGTSVRQLIKNDVKRKQLTVLKHQQVYSYLHDSNYFWEMSAVHPEWLLFDFCQIAQNKKTPMHFYQRLAE